MTLKNSRTKIIKTEAEKLGFISCGISKAEFLEDHATNLEKWLKKKYNGKMSYMERNFDKRLDPTKLVHGSKSVISLSFNYYTKKKQIDPNSFKVSKYAFGNDYHFVVKNKLNKLLSSLKDKIGDFNARVFVDSAPVMERAWAQKSGLGWVGKNTLMISKKKGSYFFLAEIICDLELDYDKPVMDHCGTCSACIDACPTNAIIKPYVLDSNKCISYLTIELKDSIPSQFENKMQDWIFGCDVCQDVCPWNKFSEENNHTLLQPSDKFLHMKKSDWIELTEETFKKVFKNSPIKRAKFNGLKKNISFIKNTN
tara:strand:- start:13020 stop:13952 length:933 start_codon:yes stop_codon:yes gene_type:complete